MFKQNDEVLVLHRGRAKVIWVDALKPGIIAVEFGKGKVDEVPTTWCVHWSDKHSKVVKSLCGQSL